MNLKEMEWVGVDWMNMCQDRAQWQTVVNTEFVDYPKASAL
jgi:hypothetical protein